MFQEFSVSVRLTIILLFVCCGLYPLAVWGGAQGLFPREANGSLIRATDSTVLGSAHVGQNFSGERYFHPRPSAAGNGYDAANSSGSNLGPTSRKLRDQIAERIAIYRQRNGLAPDQPVPADAVTASASGLDPHISLASARLQSGRVARACGLPLQRILAAVKNNTENPGWGIFGEPGVNVLKLNLELDTLAAP